MSMKRAKEVKRRGRDSETESDYFASKNAAKQWDWEKDVSVLADDAFTQYSPQARFAAGVFLMHPKFGKGVVIDVDLSRVEVLFQDGPKKLAHGLAG